MAAEIGPWAPAGWHCWSCGLNQPAVGDRVEVDKTGTSWYAGQRGFVLKIDEGLGETTTDYLVQLDDGTKVQFYGCEDVRRLGVLDLLAEI